MRLIDADALPRHGWRGGLVHWRDIENAPTIEPERKTGEWEEKEIFHNGDEEPIIKEWQSAICSVCGKYHTTPYMYYFDEYNFCPNCGARNT